MKNPLRKITINDKMYLYRATRWYNSIEKTENVKLIFFLEGHKKAPLMIEFLGVGWGNLVRYLYEGILLEDTITGLKEELNIHRPKLIRKLIFLGQEKGWNGLDKFASLNGIDLLEEMGYKMDTFRK